MNCYHIYANDITIYLAFDLGTIFANFLKHKKIIASVLKLLAALKLKVNSSKTQCMFVTNQRTRLPETFTIGGIRIEIKHRVKVLRVTLDKKLSFSSFINGTCSKSCYHLRRITSIRKFLSFDLTKLLILTLVISSLDYCKSLLYGAPDYMIKKLQRVQKRATRLLLHQGNYNGNLVLNELHWLPAEKRLTYKLLCFVYRLFKDLPVPNCLSVPPFRYQQLDQCDLRNSRERKLTVRITNNTYGKRCFWVSGAELWISLPCDLILSPSYNTFQAQLKTYLFSILTALSVRKRHLFTTSNFKMGIYPRHVLYFASFLHYRSFCFYPIAELYTLVFYKLDRTSL